MKHIIGRMWQMNSDSMNSARLSLTIMLGMALWQVEEWLLTPFIYLFMQSVLTVWLWHNAQHDRGSLFLLKVHIPKGMDIGTSKINESTVLWSQINRKSECYGRMRQNTEDPRAEYHALLKWLPFSFLYLNSISYGCLIRWPCVRKWHLHWDSKWKWVRIRFWAEECGEEKRVYKRCEGKRAWN